MNHMTKCLWCSKLMIKFKVNPNVSHSFTFLKKFRVSYHLFVICKSTGIYGVHMTDVLRKERIKLSDLVEPEYT